MRHRIPSIVLLFLFVIPLRAQEKPNPYQQMLRSKQQVTEYLIREARRITGAAAQEISSRDNWEKIREQRREETLQMLGRCIGSTFSGMPDFSERRHASAARSVV